MENLFKLKKRLDEKVKVVFFEAVLFLPGKRGLIKIFDLNDLNCGGRYDYNYIIDYKSELGPEMEYFNTLKEIEIFLDGEI